MPYAYYYYYSINNNNMPQQAGNLNWEDSALARVVLIICHPAMQWHVTANGQTAVHFFFSNPPASYGVQRSTLVTMRIILQLILYEELECTSLILELKLYL